MGKILVLYDSATGHTKKMATLVAEGASSVPGHEVRLRSIAEAKHEDVVWCDGLACGTPTNLGGISWRMKQWWDDFATDHWNKVDGKLCTSFSSQGGSGGGAEIACMAMASVLLNFGFLFFGATDYVDPDTTCHYGAVCTKDPRSTNDVYAIQRLGLRLGEWVAYYCDNRRVEHPLLSTKAAQKNPPPKLVPGIGFRGGSDAAVGDTQPVHLVVEFTVPPENRTKFLTLFSEMQTASWAEEGCLHYELLVPSGPDTPPERAANTLILVELWQSQASFAAHGASDHFKRLVPCFGELTTSKVDILTPLNAPRRAASIAAPIRKALSVLIFTAATAYVHGSLPAAAAFVSRECTRRDWEPTVTDDPALLELGGPQWDLIIFVNNSGDIFDPSKEALTAHVDAGRPVLAIHAALATFLSGEDASGAKPLEPTTLVMQNVLGAHFRNHPPPQRGLITVNISEAARVGGQVARLPSSFEIEDEFFNFTAPPASDIHVIASVDEGSYTGGTMGASHPVVWWREVGPSKAKVFVTALGHFSHFYNGRGPHEVRAFLRSGLDFVTA